MITLITGAPGTGKTAAVVSMLRELSKDRALYVCNLNGLTIPHNALEDGAKWHTDVPDGSCIVIDEVQNYWRPRGPGQKVPDHIAALETHRHRGIDFYIITQGPNLLDSNVRALVGRHVHLRELGILGRWWYEWPECADNCRTAWKNAPIKKRYRLPKKIFGDYKSASIHIKPKRSFPLMLLVLVVVVGLLVQQGWSIWAKISAKFSPPPVAAKAAPGSAAPGQATGGVPGAAGATARVIDDRIDWIPRISHRPESAPAFDALRVVAAMPKVVGGLCNAKGCRCVTQQGTNAGLSDDECKAWLANPPFDAYRVESAAQPATPGLARENAPNGDPAPALVAIDGPGWRDPMSHRGAQR